MSAELKATRQDATLILTLSNPGRRNALHPDMAAAAIETLATVERDDTMRAVVLTGADEYFCAGGDLRRLIENRAQPKSIQAASIDQLHGWIEAIRACSKPVIAAVEGGAAGAGFSLALACDFIIASRPAQFTMSYVNVGLTPDGGGSWFLSQSLPRALVTELLMTGKPVGAERLHQLGVINRLANESSALDIALQLADELARQSPHAIEGIKNLLREAPGATLPDHLVAEKNCFVDSLHHRDANEGVNAFLEKRSPNYR
jgi:enoyl-CoA hydratase/carnithine racemase